MGLRLREVNVSTIEPMINAGDWEIDTDMKNSNTKLSTVVHHVSMKHQFVITMMDSVISQGEDELIKGAEPLLFVKKLK